MSNGFIIAEKYLEDSYAWNTGKAKEIEEKYIKESYKDRHPYDLTPLTPKEADEKLLMFVKKYPNEWHGFYKDKLTKDSVKKLEKMGALKVDWDNRTFYYETKEQKDESESLFSRKDFFKFFDKHPEFKGKISIEGPREDSKGRVEFVITTPKGGKRIVVTSEKTKEELEKIGQKLLR